MDKVSSKGKVEDEFGADHNHNHGDGPRCESCVVSNFCLTILTRKEVCFCLPTETRTRAGEREKKKDETITHIKSPPSSTHMNAFNQPCVVSALTADQPSTRSNLNPRPETNALKSMSTKAQT